MMTAGNPDVLIHARIEGDGQPVILIHGMAASLYDWDHLIPELVAAGYRACALDLLGHGDSYKPDDPLRYDMDTVYALLDSWIDSLDLQAPCRLVGHSLGGYLSLRYTLAHPERVKSLFLIDPFFSPSQLPPSVSILNRRPDLGAQALQAVPQWMINNLIGWDLFTRKHFSPQARQRMAADLKRASPNILRILQRVPDLTPRLAEVRCPSQVIWGERDRTLLPSTFTVLVAALPQASGHPIPNCGHQPHISQPARVNCLIREFFSQFD